VLVPIGADAGADNVALQADAKRTLQILADFGGDSCPITLGGDRRVGYELDRDFTGVRTGVDMQMDIDDRRVPPDDLLDGG